MPDDCAFCNYSGPSEVLWEMAGCFAIASMNPVTDGHVLVIPRQHVEDALDSPMVTGSVFQAAAWYARSQRRLVPPTREQLVGEEPDALLYERPDANLITSIGSTATQTIRHLHVHVVPRRVGDGLALPWSARV